MTAMSPEGRPAYWILKSIFFTFFVTGASAVVVFALGLVFFKLIQYLAGDL